MKREATRKETAIVSSGHKVQKEECHYCIRPAHNLRKFFYSEAFLSFLQKKACGQVSYEIHRKTIR